MKAKLLELLNKWNSEEITTLSDDLHFDDTEYLFYLHQYFKDEEYKDYFKYDIIERLKSIIDYMDIPVSDFVNESREMWKELYTRGCTKEDLDKNKYPLSQYDNKTGCALCNYSVSVDRQNEHCTHCPVDWTLGTCMFFFNKWTTETCIESRKECAKIILDEITQNRKVC